MKFNIHINQKSIVDNKIDIDLKDAVILDYLKMMPLSEKIKKIVYEDRVYFWVSYKHLIQQNPLLGIKAVDSLYRRLTRLVEIGLLGVYPENKKINKSFYCLTSKYYELMLGDEVGEPTDEKSEVPTDLNPYLPTDEKSDDNNINIYNIYSNNNKLNLEKKEKKIFKKFLHLSITVDEVNQIKELGFSNEQIDQTLLDIENYKKNTQYRSLNLTLRKWLKKNYPNVKPIDQQSQLDLNNEYSRDNFYAAFND